MDAKNVIEEHDESEEEGVVDLEAELVSALEELHKERMKNKLLKKEWNKKKKRHSELYLFQRTKTCLSRSKGSMGRSLSD